MAEEEGRHVGNDVCSSEKLGPVQGLIQPVEPEDGGGTELDFWELSRSC